MSSEVDVIDKAAAFRENTIHTVALAHVARIEAEARADILEGKMTAEEWAVMDVKEKMVRYFYKGEQ